MMTRRLASTALLVVVTVFASPVAAHADPVGTVSDVVDTSTPIASLESQVVACPLSEQSLSSEYLAWQTSSSSGQVDVTWRAPLFGEVMSANSCVRGIRIEGQLHDRTTVPGCQASIDSKVFRADSDVPTHWFSGKVDYSLSEPVLELTVPYFDSSGSGGGAVPTVTNTSDTPSNITTASLKCERVRSTVTIDASAYYKNYLGQYVLYCTQRTTYEFVATPAGPEQVGDPLYATSC